MIDTRVRTANMKPGSKLRSTTLADGVNSERFTTEARRTRREEREGDLIV